MSGRLPIRYQLIPADHPAGLREEIGRGSGRSSSNTGPLNLTSYADGIFNEEASMGNRNLKARMKTLVSKGLYWLKLGLGMRVAADVELA